MKISNHAVAYYLFLASQKAVAEKIIGDIFGSIGDTWSRVRDYR